VTALAGRTRAWVGAGVAVLVLFVLAPALLSDFRLSLLAKFLCFAIVAVGIGLAWGRGGMLVLGQGVFFGMGGYLMGMHLKVADAQLLGNGVPDFMQIGGINELPGYWEPFASPAFTVLMIVLLPTAIAVALGFGMFKRRVKGAYFAILSQALAAALAILLVGQSGLGGSNGLNNFRTFFGFALNDPVNRQMLYFIAAAVLLIVLAVTRQLMRSRYGELLVAVRDGEERVRFLGSVEVIQQYYSAADLCIHPARYDPFPSAVIEALACGLPVLTTPGCGGADAIEDGKSGYIVDSPSQLVDGLRLIADQDRRVQMGELARRRALTFSQPEQIRRLVELIEQVGQELGATVP